MSVHICQPATVTFRSVRHCPTCGRRRRFVGVAAVWYGATWTCLGCGDSWGDGERIERPFARGWRQRSIDIARRRWAAAPSADEARRLFALMVRQEIDQ